MNYYFFYIKKRNAHFLAFALFFLYLRLPLFCQTESCATDYIFQKNLHKKPDIHTKIAQTNKIINNWLSENYDDKNSDSRSIISIPVVIHVVWFSEEENISDAQILSQIAVLNQDFNKKNTDINLVPNEFKDRIANINIEFCLAKTDPNGNPSNGIIRRQTSVDGIGWRQTFGDRRRVFYNDYGGSDAWDNKKYLNIWVARLEGGIFGFTIIPEIALYPEEDGIVIDPHYFGTTGLAASDPRRSRGRTTTHEIGHYFNLYHVWGLSHNGCNDDNDMVNDTPPQRSFYSGCPSYPQTSCGKSNMFMNFMDYVDDNCMYAFTKGQQMRMWAYLFTKRSNLLLNNACNSHFSGFGSARVSFFPNPLNDYLFIYVNDDTTEQPTARIFDTIGRLIFEEKIPIHTTKSLYLPQLNTGIYFLQIIGNDWKETHKIIKN